MYFPTVLAETDPSLTESPSQFAPRPIADSLQPSGESSGVVQKEWVVPGTRAADGYSVNLPQPLGLILS